MSPHNMGHFVQDLVEMAKATEQLPIVTLERDEARQHLTEAAEVIAAREETILRLKAEIEALHANLKQVEVDRDNAETMFLQESDRTQAALSLVRTFMDQGQALLDAQSPSPAMPVAATPEPTPEPAVERQAEPVTDFSTLLSEPIPAVLISGDPANIDSVSSGPKDGAESAADPTVSEWSNETGSVASSQPATTSENASQPTTTDTSSAYAGNTVDASATDRVSVSSDPTPATETTSENASPASAQPDDVGYHNEPINDRGMCWDLWNIWADRMNQRYPDGWPSRNA